MLVSCLIFGQSLVISFFSFFCKYFTKILQWFSVQKPRSFIIYVRNIISLCFAAVIDLFVLRLDALVNLHYCVSYIELLTVGFLFYPSMLFTVLKRDGCIFSIFSFKGHSCQGNFFAFICNLSIYEKYSNSFKLKYFLYTWGWGL